MRIRQFKGWAARIPALLGILLVFISWVHGNLLGVPQMYTNATGAVIATPAYTLPGFPGQFRTLADIYYNTYRDYDIGTGRYIQADPIGLSGGTSPYLYANGNPVQSSGDTTKFRGHQKVPGTQY